MYCIPIEEIAGHQSGNASLYIFVSNYTGCVRNSGEISLSVWLYLVSSSRDDCFLYSGMETEID